MADYNTLKNAITAVIRTNYNEEITGQILQDVLIGMVDALGSGYLLMGVATPGTSPGTPDANVAYLTATAGSYANFDDIVVNDEIALLVWDGSWHKQTLANAFTDTEKTKLAGIEAGAQVNPPIDVELDPDSHNAVENAVIAAAVQAIYDTLDTKADKNGEAPEAIVGTAQGLRGKVIAEMFTNRITGKGIVGSGAAMMTALRGRTLKWNQLIKNGNFANGGSNWNYVGGSPVYGNGYVELTAVANGQFYQDASAVVGHKYLQIVSLISTAAGALLNCMGSSYFTVVLSANTPVRDARFVTANSTSLEINIRNSTVPNGEKYRVSNFVRYDLTDMFGAGYEPATVAEFTALYNEAYYAQNNGALLPFKGTGLQIGGLNKWDEQWVNGTFSTVNGSEINTGTPLNQIRSKNNIPIFANTKYYIHVGLSATMWCFFMDANGNIITDDVVGAALRSGVASAITNNEFITPANAASMKFYLTANYGNTYGNNICINVSGPLNGTYKPYRTPVTLSLPVTTATANNGEDVPFADGMNGFGGVFDLAKIVNGWCVGGRKQFVTVDFGSEIGAIDVSAAPLVSIQGLQGVIKAPATNNDTANIMCSGYTVTSRANVSNNDKSVCVNLGGVIVINDSALTSSMTSEQVRSYLSGKKLTYQLATPVDYTFDTPFPVIYSEDRDGTETVLPVGVDANGVPNTAPMDATIEYPINADQLISADSMRSYLEARKTAGEISAYTMVWNQTTQQYDFTITT